MDLIADTTFLIDLWREQRQPGPAWAFARNHDDWVIGLPWVVVGEFLSGGVIAGHRGEQLMEFIQHYPIIHTTIPIVRQYAETYAFIRQHGIAIGPNDLWIAACASTLKLPMVTRNTRDFQKLPELQILNYEQ